MPFNVLFRVIGLKSRVFTKWSRWLGFQSKVEYYQRLKKNGNLMRPCLTTQHCKVRMKGRGAIYGMELRPFHIPRYSSYRKKEAFGLPSTTYCRFLADIPPHILRSYSWGAIGIRKETFPSPSCSSLIDFLWYEKLRNRA